jgi:hypothetical protein
MADFDYVFVQLHVGDVERFAWYERVFGRPPDMRPHAEEVVWRLTDTAAVAIAVGAERAGGGELLVVVDDLDRVAVELAARGVDPEPVEVVEQAGRKLPTRDPDGNLVVFLQVN